MEIGYDAKLMKIGYDAKQWEPKRNNRGLRPIIFLALLCVIGVTFLLYSNPLDINWKKMSLNKQVQTNVYNEAFDNGVNCGVEALMFFVKQGKKEIDINAVRAKATELRKKENKK